MTRLTRAELDQLTAAWEQALTAASAPLTSTATLSGLAHRLARATVAGLACPAEAELAGEQIGHLLVEGHLTAPDVLQQAVMLLGEQQPRGATDSQRAACLDCLKRRQGAVVLSHSAATRRLLLAQQEAIHRAAITARDQAERAWRDSAARFQALFTEAAVGIAIGDVGGRVLEVDQTFHRMLGDTLPEFLDRPVEQFVHPDDAAGTWQDYAALIAGDIDSFHAEKPYLHRDGHAVWTHLTQIGE